MNIYQRVMNLENKKDVRDDDWILITHILCKTYGWTWQELKKQPIRFVFGLMMKIAYEKKKEQESTPKTKGFGGRGR